jgi:hypothetical protein
VRNFADGLTGISCCAASATGVPLPKAYAASPTKDGGTLRTVLDVRTYMLALPKRRETRTQWQRAAELLLGEADVAAFSKAVELALFYDAKSPLD